LANAERIPKDSLYKFFQITNLTTGIKTVKHNLNTTNIIVVCRNSNGERVLTPWKIVNANEIYLNTKYEISYVLIYSFEFCAIQTLTATDFVNGQSLINSGLKTNVNVRFYNEEYGNIFITDGIESDTESGTFTKVVICEPSKTGLDKTPNINCLIYPVSNLSALVFWKNK
jgi:hypothetical protein